MQYLYVVGWRSETLLGWHFWERTGTGILCVGSMGWALSEWKILQKDVKGPGSEDMLEQRCSGGTEVHRGREVS